MKLLKLLNLNKNNAEEKQQGILDTIEQRGETQPNVSEALELAKLYREILDCEHGIKEILDNM